MRHKYTIGQRHTLSSFVINTYNRVMANYYEITGVAKQPQNHLGVT